ncbi:probable serine protease EDA2 isoform X4 [Triticum aestivum]|uniref:Serine protease EDA2 n=1 Tax=Triticum aestivum TaxID=4565 RepID=A0A3B5YY00_WHEAT|nr:probable serine protease EDA2 isoform X4 [Triticum aestivum]
MVSRAGFASLLGASFLLLLRSAEPLGFNHRPTTAGDELSAAPSRYLTREERWMSQRLDHFSPTDHRQFKQRYFEFLDYHDDPNGPVFLRICGESSCDGLPNDYLAVIAKKFGAAVVTPEHRYYGKSSPFDSLTTDNLRFLSSKQALFDLAVFRQYYQEKLNSQYNRSAGFDNPWFVFGVSYSGALSAWFRLKFPHLTCGSLASSGVVLAVYNFTDFDKQVGESAGPQCKAALQEITRLVDEQLRSDSHSVKALFGADSLKNDGDFLFLLADAAATTFQYGNPDALCSPLANAKKKGESLVVLDFGGSKFAVKLPIFKSHPKMTVFVLRRSIQASKIVFTNGSQDPWRHASKQKSSEDMPSYIIKCSNCGHGTDLRGCPQLPFRIEGDSSNCTSPEAVNTVRKQIVKHIDLWLSQCHEPTRAW